MWIDSHGNNGHSDSHTSCFPFLPIPIPKFVTNSHSHGNPMGFPFPLGIPFPWSSLPCSIDSLLPCRLSADRSRRQSSRLWTRSRSRNTQCRCSILYTNTQHKHLVTSSSASQALASPGFGSRWHGTKREQFRSAWYPKVVFVTV